MNLVGHGGGCCGMRHIRGFSSGPKQLEYHYGNRRTRGITRLKNLIKEHDLQRAPNRGKLFEVVITDGQFQANPDWVPELKKLDFRLVSRFHNSTGGWCNVFHKITGNSRDDIVPTWWSEN